MLLFWEKTAFLQRIGENVEIWAYFTWNLLKIQDSGHDGKKR